MRALIIRHLKTFCCATFLFLAIYQSVFATNTAFLKTSALSNFTMEDKRLMEANMVKTLNRVKDGQKSVWKNSQTGAWGFAAPLKTTVQGGKVCRIIKTYNQAGGVKGVAQYRWCKKTNTRNWQIAVVTRSVEAKQRIIAKI